MRIILICLIALLTLPLPASAGGPPEFSDRPGVGQPLRFTTAAGAVFRPRALIVITPSATLRAELPATSNDARSEEHLDFSAAPVVGRYFRQRLAPSDAARDGQPVGQLSRIGAALVLDARAAPVAVNGLGLVLTANFPRDGAVSYYLGIPGYAAGTVPAGAGEPAGAAYVVDGRLVLAGAGRGPLIEDWNAVFGARR